MPLLTKKPITLVGARPGKNLVVMAGVHGNETCGVRAFEELLPSLTIEAGTVTFLYGNLEAIRKNKRLIEANLNRLFRPVRSLSARERASKEFVRAQELKPLLKRADALLDIHSSATKGSTPFIICEPHSFDIAKRLPFPIISSGWDAAEPGGTDYFVNASGGHGICIECGYHDDPVAVRRAKESLLVFLDVMGARPARARAVTERKRFVEVYRLHKTRTNFVPARAFGDFERVRAGTLIGHDGATRVCAPENSYVLFVRPCSGAGGEAFLLARTVRPAERARASVQKRKASARAGR